MGNEDDDTREIQATPSRRKFWWSHQVAVSNITHLDVFYGSCTGTAQALATQLAQKATKRGVVVSLKEMNAFDPTHFDEEEQGAYYSLSRASVFVMSTHYAGPAPNAEVFVQWLRQATEPTKGPTVHSDASDSPAKSSEAVPGSSIKNNRVSPATSPIPPRLASSHSTFNWRHLFGGSGDVAKTKRKRSYARLQFAVFGVGNSTYLTYNAMGKLLDSRLHTLGAARLCPLGLGDVSNDISSTFSTWASKLLQKLALDSAELGISAIPRPTRKIAPRRLLSTGSAAQLTTPRRSSGPILAAQSQGRRQRRNSVLRRSSSASARSTERQGRSIREGAESQPATPLALTVLDFNGRPVHLRFRCRFLSSEHADESRKTGCNSLLPATSFTSPAEGGRQPSEPALQSWVSLKSLTMLPGSEDANRLALLRLSIEDPMVNFEAADSFGFFPPNALVIVHDIARQLGFDLDAYVEILVQAKDPETPLETTEAAGDSLSFPRVCTVRTILQNFLELRTVSREFVRLASDFVTVPKERDLLESLASADGAAAFGAGAESAHPVRGADQHRASDQASLSPDRHLPAPH